MDSTKVYFARDTSGQLDVMTTGSLISGTFPIGRNTYSGTSLITARSSSSNIIYEGEFLLVINFENGYGEINTANTTIPREFSP